jgi:hypothetical protein
LLDYSALAPQMKIALTLLESVALALQMKIALILLASVALPLKMVGKQCQPESWISSV